MQFSKKAEYSIYNTDAMQWLKSLASNSVDLVITDPPYESIEKHRAVGTTTRLKVSKASSNLWFECFPDKRLGALMRELYRVLKPNRHCYVFCDGATMFQLKPLGEKAGFKFWKPLVWDKQNIGMGYHYRSRHEFILFFEKGKRKLNDLATADVLRFPRVTKGYPTEKPLELVKLLVKQSAQPGELVVDPFAGSGVTLEAAHSVGCVAAGNDLSQRAFDWIRARMQNMPCAPMQ